MQARGMRRYSAHISESASLIQARAWLDEADFRSRSRALLSDYVSRLKIWYKLGGNNSEMCVPSFEAHKAFLAFARSR